MPSKMESDTTYKLTTLEELIASNRVLMYTGVQSGERADHNMFLNIAVSDDEHS